MQKPKDTEPCPHCGRFENRGVSIDALIIKGNQILLIKRKFEPFKGVWALPGGYVEWNEDLSETIKREVKEETNLEVTKYSLVDVYSDPNRDPRQPITVVYKVETNGEEKPGDDAEEAQWFDLDNLPELAFDHLQIIVESKN